MLNLQEANATISVSHISYTGKCYFRHAQWMLQYDTNKSALNC